MTDRQVAFLVRDGDSLRCGVCHRRAGFIRFDGTGWPYLVVLREECATCERRLAVNPDRLEADTAARYRVS